MHTKMVTKCSGNCCNPANGP